MENNSSKHLRRFFSSTMVEQRHPLDLFSRGSADGRHSRYEKERANDR
jgi:hypothetical protein